MRKKFRIIHILLTVEFICIAALMYLSPPEYRWIPPVFAAVILLLGLLASAVYDEI